MGNVAYRQVNVPDPADIKGPHCMNEPSFDPNFGFPNGRKERVMIATEEEMISAKIPLEERDYCAHKLLDYRACRADVFPFVYKCHHAKHDYLTCQYEDYVIRMKELERERRLYERQNRIEKRNFA
ncbi:NADH dehydrogenase [ubiquinone] 1 beta subcomplex subunit 7 [Pseudolycoriella hygida]|uniref:NADH dehydrogenase [ubiquinone] 1 beta subcomplex subunit 7 n=1 Tax=Pseudolycoriella hygida TaxID=35572 RepID=A0A9Q0S2K1_9DIPT|nr:NADH dehydrogenase [ubiquinone] 1 beta subcomplex subunit 7 [Pseudolycoriella hygida]